MFNQEMFNQIFVSPEDREILRFLWWPDANLEAEAKDHQMTVHLFGATSSPSCCNFALRQVAHHNALGVDEDVLQVINCNFYADDFLKSFETSKEARRVVERLRAALEHSWFHLTKFLSNRENAWKCLSEEERRTLSLDLDLKTRSESRTFGVQ